jgi:antitoxin component YwqK of YwqJK toxin-antitoxin module
MKNTRRDGAYKEHNRHGILVREGKYRNGMRIGTWRIYNELTGKLVIEEDYEQGVLNGIYRSFYEDGSVFSIGHYHNNKRDGEFRIFDREGSHIMTMRFHDDILLQVTDYKTKKKAGMKPSAV